LTENRDGKPGQNDLQIRSDPVSFQLDEARLATWVKQAAALPGWVP